MSRVSVVAITMVSLTSPAYAYPGMAGSCTGPQAHSGAGGTAATDTTGYSLSVESTSSSGIFDVTVTSTITFKGFLVKAKEQSNDGAQILGFESLPAGSTYLNSCPDPEALVSRTAISHTNSNAKSSVTAQLNCGLYEGDVTVTAYLVTSYTSPYISLSKVFTCTSSGSETIDPSTVGTTSAPGTSGTGDDDDEKEEEEEEGEDDNDDEHEDDDDVNNNTTAVGVDDDGGAGSATTPDHHDDGISITTAPDNDGDASSSAPTYTPNSVNLGSTVGPATSTRNPDVSGAKMSLTLSSAALGILAIFL